ncbi:MAG: lytic transglycosylase domain-containing protein [Desulfobacterales bacterium]
MMKTIMRRHVLPGVGNRSNLPSGIRSRADSPAAGQPADRASSAFARLLSDRVNVNGRTDAPLQSTAPLSPQVLLRYIAMIRTQMNSALFRTLDEPDDDISSPADSLSWPGSFLMDRPSDLSALSAYAAQQTRDSSLPTEIDRIVDHASRTYDLDSGLIDAVIQAESDYDPDSTSPKGAMGLMQLMPETAKDLGVKDPYNPAENIMAGSRYLKQLLDRYDQDIPLALAAYNWGMGNIERHPDRLPEETRTYITRVDGYYQKRQRAERSNPEPFHQDI